MARREDPYPEVHLGGSCHGALREDPSHAEASFLRAVTFHRGRGGIILQACYRVDHREVTCPEPWI